MVDILLFIIGFVAVFLIMLSFFLGWYKGNKNNEAFVKKFFLGRNVGVANIVGKGMVTIQKIVDFSGDPVAQVTKTKKIKLETRDKDGKPLFYYMGLVPNVLYNEEKATPIPVDSLEEEILSCPTCERSGEEIGEPYYADGDKEQKRPLCPYCGDHPELVRDTVSMPVNPNNVGTAKEEPEHLFNIAQLIEGVEVAKVQARFFKLLSDIGLAKLLLIAILILQLVTVVILATGGKTPNPQDIIGSVKNATMGIT